MRVSTSSYACIFLRMRVKRKLHVCVLDPILGTEKQGTDADKVTWCVLPGIYHYCDKFLT